MNRIPTTADQNLLFGVIALQMDFIRREQLVAATSTWLTDKSRGLDEILVEQGALKRSDRQLLAPLVARHLENHDGDATRSLAALSSMGSVADDLRSLGDEKIEATLSMVSTSIHAEDARPNPPEAMPPSDSGSRFRILRPHAKGGLGEVSLAQDTEVNREVALKQILPEYANDEQCRARFTLEAEITGGLEHPGIVPVYGLGRYDDGRPFYAMRFIKGDSLQEAAQRLHGGGAVDYNSVEFRKLLGRFIDVCEAIEYAHSRGVLHRDLKPGNIMLGKYGETLVVDWGLAKAKGRDDVAVVNEETTLRPASSSGTAPTRMGSAIGTPAFMPPEQAVGNLHQLGPASDIYSLGATLYYVLTAARPFASGQLDEVLAAVQRGDFPPPRKVKPEIPRPLEAICLKAMSLHPGDRYSSPLTLADDVQRWLGDEPVTAYHESWTARVQRWVRRHQTLAAAFTAVLLAGLAALAVSTFLIARAQRDTANALQKEKIALREANQQREEANRQRADADKQRDIAERATLLSRRTSANLAFDRARTLSEGGQPDIGLHWYIRAMELAPEGDEAFHDLIRTNLAEWRSETASLRLHLFLSRGGAPDGAQLSSDGAFLYMVCREDVGVVQWNTETEEARLFLIPGVEATLESIAGSGLSRTSVPVVLSPDETVCTAGLGNKVYFWNVGDQSLVGAPLTLDSPVTALDYAPNGQTIAVGCEDGSCGVFDVVSKQPAANVTPHEAAVRTVQFRYDGQVLMTAAFDMTIRRWNPANGEQIEPALKHDKIGVNSAAWSPDGSRIVSSDLAAIKVWDAESGESILSHPANGGAYDLEFSQDGELLAAALGDGTVRIWDARTFEPLYHPIQQNDAAHFVAFDAPRRHLYTVGAVPILRKWRLPTSALKSTNIDGPNNRMDIDPSGNKIALGGMKGILVLCDTKTGDRIGDPLDFEEPIASLTFNRRGDLLLVTGFRGASRVYETDRLQQVGETLNSKGIAFAGAFLDDQQVAIGSMQEGVIRIFNFRTGRVAKPQIKQPGVSHLDIVGNKMVIGSWTQEIATWDFATGKELNPRILTGAQLLTLRFSPDGRRFAAGGMGHYAMLWDADTNQSVARLLHESAVEDLHFSRDGRLLATSAQDNTVRLWHLATGKPVGPLLPIGDLTKVRFDERNRILFPGYVGDQQQLFTWERPPGWQGDTDELRLRAIVETGLELDADGNYRVLSPEEWTNAARGLRGPVSAFSE